MYKYGIKVIRFFFMYVSRINATEVVLMFAAMLCLISVLFRIFLKDNINKKNLSILISVSLYISLLLELTILSREPETFSCSDNDFFLTIKMMLQNSGESQMYPDIIGNIVLFIPCGIFLKMLLKKSGWTILVSFFVTLAIETVQLLTGRGLFEMSDLLFNTLGATIGVIIYRLLNATID